MSQALSGRLRRRLVARAAAGRRLNPALSEAATAERVRVCVDAMQRGDEAAVRDAGIDRKTLYEWRKRPEVQEAIRAVTARVETAWTERIPAFMEGMIAIIQEKARDAQPGDLGQIAFAAKQIAEVAMTWDLLRAKVRFMEAEQRARGTPPADPSTEEPRTAGTPAALEEPSSDADEAETEPEPESDSPA